MALAATLALAVGREAPDFGIFAPARPESPRTWMFGSIRLDMS